MSLRTLAVVLGLGLVARGGDVIEMGNRDTMSIGACEEAAGSCTDDPSACDE